MKHGPGGTFLVTLLTLAGCAVPLTQTVKEYVAPATVEGKACVEDCVKQRTACQVRCRERYASYRESVVPEARERHARRLQEYERALAAYCGELERYRLELMWGARPPHWGGWWYPPFPPPPPPALPTLEGEVARLEKERCDHDCGCEAGFDACFKGCGGGIRFETRCGVHCGGG